MKLIISVENLKEFRPLSEDIPPVRINPFIQEAHQIDLKNLLGGALYVDLLAKFDNSGASEYAAYKQLIDGLSYTSGGVTLEHPGLVGFLCYSALARFYANNQINVTKFGIVNKTNDQSTPVEYKVIQASIEEMRSNALALRVDIIKYLQANPTSYPLFSYADGSLSDDLGVKFFDPDNRPAGVTSPRTIFNL